MREPAAVPRPAAAEPLAPEAFAALMARFAPFEPAPTLAVAVSGGADSMALALLAHDWARAGGGRAVGLIVDHGLRAEAPAEAALVRRWLRMRGIEAHVLTWTGPKPLSGVQAAAREARYRLLTDWCAAAGILHLMLAHHARDQAETVQMRRLRGSGPAGLAGAPALVELARLRLLRPLLALAPERLRATLAARGQPWIDDPSNADTRFARVRVRAALAASGCEAALAETAGRQAAARVADEAALAAMLARSAAIRPEGWARLAAGPFLAAPPALRRRALAQLLLAVGGGAYPVRSERLERLHGAIVAGQVGGGRTLGGCRIAPGGHGSFLIMREAGAVRDAIALAGPAAVTWDNRFEIRVAGEGPYPPGLRIAALGAAGWSAIARSGAPPSGLPAPIRHSLPALWDLDGVVQVPHLEYRRRARPPVNVSVVSTVFRPRHALAGPGFAPM